jgi:hypothetical protein
MVPDRFLAAEFLSNFSGNLGHFPIGLQPKLSGVYKNQQEFTDSV